MRRALALTNEAARHPLRRSFPPAPPSRLRPRGPQPSRATLEDQRDFLLAFLAFFLAASVFFA